MLTFGDLLSMEGQVIECYEVQGRVVKVKKYKIELNYTAETIHLLRVDKLGRAYYDYCTTVPYNGDCNNPNLKESCVWLSWYHNSYIFLDKERAYKFLINRLRADRREISKRILDMNMELYGKKMVVKNEG